MTAPKNPMYNEIHEVIGKPLADRGLTITNPADNHIRFGFNLTDGSSVSLTFFLYDDGKCIVTIIHNDGIGIVDSLPTMHDMSFINSRAHLLDIYRTIDTLMRLQTRMEILEYAISELAIDTNVDISPTQIKQNPFNYVEFDVYKVPSSVAASAKRLNALGLIVHEYALQLIA